MRSAIGLVGWLLLSFSAAGIGAVASINASDFYGQLARPNWAPPASVFGPVWSVLYALMGIAAWLVWREAGFRGARTALTLFIVQLVANALWSWVFFVWKQGALAFVDALLLGVLVSATCVSFWAVRPLAAGLLVPYWLWVSYAIALTYSVWQRNPRAL